MRRLNERGVTLTELMVATVILSVGVIGAMASFKYITTAISSSRIKAIASNLAQEKMEVIKNQPYFQVSVTTSQTASTGYSPNFIYDNSNYVEAPIVLWGLPALTRVVEVDYAQVSGLTVSTVPFNSNDTGMKMITVTVFWTDQSTKKKVQFSSYYENPSVAVLSTGFTGSVAISPGGAPLSGALVQVVGTPKWRTTSAADGTYTFQVSPGSYTVMCSSPGYTTQTSAILSVAQSVYAPVPQFNMTAIATGTIGATSVYSLDTDLVISQVVSASATYTGAMTPVTYEYVELFNATTRQINVTSAGFAQKYYTLNYSGKNSGADVADVMTNKAGVFVSTYVAPGSYYLIANTSFFLQNTWVRADAYYTGSIQNPGECGAFQLKNVNTAATADQVGWAWTSGGGNCVPGHPLYGNGAIIPTAAGIVTGYELVRFSSAGANNAVYGRAYNSGGNSNDFYYNNAGIPTPCANGTNCISYPVNSLLTAQSLNISSFPVISGIPATNGRVFASDGNSAGAKTLDFTVPGPQSQNCPISSVTLVGVATGTWSFSAVTTVSSQMVTGVTIAQGVTTMIENAATTPQWPGSGLNVVALTNQNSGGYAEGIVYGAGPNFSSRLAQIKMQSSDFQTTTTDSQGYYFLSLSTGLQTITANYDNSNGQYTTANAAVTVAQGTIASVPDIHLPAGGYFKGYVTSGTGALPNVVVQANDAGGQAGQDTSDGTGYFYIFASTSALARSINPVLDALSSYVGAPLSPCTGTAPISCTMPTAGSSVFVGTFTVTGSLGTISGSVKFNGSPITTGVLIMASTATISDPPNAVVASSAPSLTTYYSVSSQADGTYSLPLRAATSTYHMRAWYPVINPDTGTLDLKPSKTNDVAGGVGAGATVANQNFTWP